ncbi:MAG: histone deacetylase [Planctomycetes bacterium]|nr:histone deacetylase [Planctomycetota bacterium]
MSERVLLVTDDRMLEHDSGLTHPECPRRLAALLEALRAQPRDDVVWGEPAAVTEADLLAVHTPEHVARIEALRGSSAKLDWDTGVSPGSVDAAHLAAGCAIEAVRSVFGGETRRAFALVRPPGHHAESGRAMGFCLYNNIAIAARYATRNLGVERVLIVDWDVHHGNGTQEIFDADADVLFVSSHQSPLYPGTGAIDERGKGAGLGYTVNLPVPAGTDDETMIALYRDVVPPVAARFAPDLVLVSAGFDAHRDDPLGGLEVTTKGFGALCGIVRDVADRFADGRLVLVLEGGYDVEALVDSTFACLDVMAE